jgi:predicted XRE-type DNA-binding protein
MAKKSMVNFKSTEELARRLGFSKAETEIILMKGTVIGQLDKEREKRGLNNTQFADFLGIPKSRWSSVLSKPEKVTLDYLLTLAARCGTLFKLMKKAA